MNEILTETREADESRQPVEVKLATVAEVLSNGLRLQFDGMSEATNKIYKCNASCMFSVGDRVKVTKHSGTYLVDYVIGAPGGGDVSALSNGSVSVTLTSDGDLIPSAAGAIDLGSSSYPFGLLYVAQSAVIASRSNTTVKLASSTGKIGFFGTSPVAQQTVANNATVATLITALKAYGLIR